MSSITRTIINAIPHKKRKDQERNRQACGVDYAHNVRTAELHTSDRLLLEAVREVREQSIQKKCYKLLRIMVDQKKSTHLDAQR